MNGAHEPLDRIGCRIELAPHASACVQYDTNTDRCVLIVIEVRKQLAPAVFLDDEIPLLQALNVASAGVDHSGVDIYELDVYSKAVLRCENSRSGQSNRESDSNPHCKIIEVIR